MSQKSFILTNEKEANAISTRILLFSVFAFPALILLSVMKIFDFNMSRLIFLSIIGSIGAISPFVLRLFKLNETLLKYFTIIMSTLVIGLLNTNYQVGINLMYLFPLALSCLYFDRLLTLATFLVGIVNLWVTLYIRTAGDPASIGHINDIYISKAAGYTMEFILLSLIFIMLAGRTKRLLQGLVGSEEQAFLLGKLKEVMSKSAGASDTLASSVTQLSATLEDTARSNDVIAQNATKAAEGCESNLKFIENTSDTIENISVTQGKQSAPWTETPT
jgi:hypothetical protein